MAIYWTTDGHGTVAPEQSLANLGQARLPSDAASPQENARSGRRQPIPPIQPAQPMTRTATGAACRSSISRPTTKRPSYGPPTADVQLRHGGLETAPAERRTPTVRRAVVGREPRVRPHTFGRPFVRVIIIRPTRCGAAATGPWMQERARGRAPCRRTDRLRPRIPYHTRTGGPAALPRFGARPP